MSRWSLVTLLIGLSVAGLAAAEPVRVSGAELRCEATAGRRADEVYLRVPADGGAWEQLPGGDGEAQVMTAGGELGVWRVKHRWPFEEQLVVELWLERGKKDRRLGVATVLAADPASELVLNFSELGSYTLAMRVEEEPAMSKRAHDAAQAAWRARLKEPDAERFERAAGEWTVIRRELSLTAGWGASPMVEEVSALVTALRAARLAPDEADESALWERQRALRSQLAAAGMTNATITGAFTRLEADAPPAQP